MFEHPRVRLDPRQGRRIVGLQNDVLAQEARQHVREVAQHRVQIENFRLHYLFAAEHQQLAGQGRRAAGGVTNLLQGSAKGLVAAAPRQQGIGIALDDGQDVVEVVGDAGGQLPD